MEWHSSRREPPSSYLAQKGWALMVGVAMVIHGHAETESVKQSGAFYSKEIAAKVRRNVQQHEWAEAMQQALIERARPWVEMSDEELWGLMFGPTITRTWMVWSDGYCPACRKDVRMYTWIINPFAHPWKVRCPQCEEIFPKNDFERFHRSGQDVHGVFQPSLADPSLLFNAEHPDPNDPLHRFGVDDGEGYVAEGHTWRFIGCYLIYGQWKQWVHAGVVNLSAAYAVTADPKYAYKAAILLDRVADVFPSFDFGQQGLVYETREATRGQVSTWHDACEEVKLMALAYDQIFEGAREQEKELVAFLSRKAAEYQLPGPKSSWADIQRNIEKNIFQDTLNHRERIESNYPTTDVALLIIRTVLNWPANREEVLTLLDAIIEQSTAVDGVSGEKGLDGYGRIAPQALAVILGRFSLLEPEFLRTLYDRHPVLHQTFRFHIDTWCMEEWYPRTGDTGVFAGKNPTYAGVPFSKSPGVEPSMATFSWNLYELTGDVAFVQVLFKTNGGTVEGLPYDLFADDPASFRAQVQDVIEKHGPILHQASVNKPEWCLAILRSGNGEHQRALWLDYDAWGRHGHADALNLGLFAKGLDLLPDFGYPPVGYGGWLAPKAVWYKSTAAHNTVVVDGQNQRQASGKTTFWAEGKRFRAVRAHVPEAAACEQYERIACMVDVDDKDFYIVDCFFVVGGREHAKYFHASFGKIETGGLSLQNAEPYSHDTQMRNFQADSNPEPGWWVDWQIEDRYGYLPAGRRVGLRYTDLTSRAAACLAEGWVETRPYASNQETTAWIPRLIVRHTTDEPPLRSAFISVIEPYEGQPRLRGVRRLPLETIDSAALPDEFVGIELTRDDGLEDVCLLVDGRGIAEFLEPLHDIHLRGELALVTFGPGGLQRLALGNTEWIRVGPLRLVLRENVEFVELICEPDAITVASGPSGAVTTATRNGAPISVAETGSGAGGNQN